MHSNVESPKAKSCLPPYLKSTQNSWSRSSISSESSVINILMMPIFISQFQRHGSFVTMLWGTARGKRHLETESQQKGVIVETESMTPWSFHPVLLTGLHFLWKSGNNEQEGLWPTAKVCQYWPFLDWEILKKATSVICQLDYCNFLSMELEDEQNAIVDLLIGDCWSWQNKTHRGWTSLVISKLQV